MENAKTLFTYPLDGSQEFPVAFDYLARKFVKVRLVPVVDTEDKLELVLGTDFRFVEPRKIVTAIIHGSDGYKAIEIYRLTSATERLVNFQNGSILRATELNVSHLQALHVAEEARDAMSREVQPAIDDIEQSFRKNLRVTDVDLLPLPNAEERRNKMLGFGDDGQSMLMLPATGTAADVMVELAKPSGAGLIGAGDGKTVADNLALIGDAITESAPDEVNIAQLIADREAALSSDVVRFVTWNIQGYYLVANEVSPTPPDVVDTRRFNRDVASPQRIREQMEWILKMGADVVSMQEVCTMMHSKEPWQPLSALCSTWQMYPYHQSSYFGVDSYSYPEMVVGNPAGNLQLATRPLKNGKEWNMYAPLSPYSPYNTLTRNEFTVGNKTIAIYNVHLNVNFDEIDKQVTFIAGLLAEDKATHIILGGDWNRNDDITYKKIIDLGFTMVNKNGELGTYNGLHANWGQWYLDRFFHRGFSAQLDYGIWDVPRELGDHKPLWVDLKL